MKKNVFRSISCIIILCLLFTSFLTGCSKEDYAKISDAVPAINYHEKITIDNGYYNYKAGGHFACVGDSLYVVLLSDVWYVGAYKINSEGQKSLTDSFAVFDWSFTAPQFYQVDDRLYLYNHADGRMYEYDCEKDKITDQTLHTNENESIGYLSDDLCLYLLDETEQLKVRYRDNESVVLDEKGWEFCVDDGKIYFISNRGWLYVNDPASLNSKCEFISYLNDTGHVPGIAVCQGYCYFLDIGSEMTGGDSALCRYSFLSKKTELVMKGDVLSLNRHHDTVYFAMKSGVYAADKDGCRKLCDVKAEEVYIFGDEWIYMSDNQGTISRVSQDGKRIEKILF